MDQLYLVLHTKIYIKLLHSGFVWFLRKQNVYVIHFECFFLHVCFNKEKYEYNLQMHILSHHCSDLTTAWVICPTSKTNLLQVCESTSPQLAKRNPVVNYLLSGALPAGQSVVQINESRQWSMFFKCYCLFKLRRQLEELCSRACTILFKLILF